MAQQNNVGADCDISVDPFCYRTNSNNNNVRGAPDPSGNVWINAPGSCSGYTQEGLKQIAQCPYNTVRTGGVQCYPDVGGMVAIHYVCKPK